MSRPSREASTPASGSASPVPGADGVPGTFPRAGRSVPGYDVAQVDGFLARARRGYDGEGGAAGVDAAAIRHTSFRMRRGGYSPSHVDAALERLEDAFAARERERGVARMGQEAWLRQARDRADEITGRLARPDGEKFRRVGRMSGGYDPAEVDRFLIRVQRFFSDNRPMSVDEVRQVVFRTRRGGYSEAQVDLLLDAVVDVMLAVR
ncbi:DivIVA domain-containing protein [Microbacteriaceae bacterium 4G12]